MLFRNPQLLWLLLLLPALAMLWLGRRGRVLALAVPLRLAAVALLVVALADPAPGVEAPASEGLVVLVDQSDSLGAGRPALLAEARRIAEAAGPHAALIAFGADVALLPPEAAGAPAARAPDGRASDLAGALRSARSLLGAEGRVVLLSDGLETDGEALAEARLAAADGIVVDVLPAAPSQAAELSLTGLSAPQTLRSGEEFPIRIGLAYRPGPAGSPSAPATLRLWDGDQLLAEEQIALEAGASSLTFRHRAGAPGVVGLRAELAPPEGEPDTFPENNVAATTALVAPPPRVLVVEGRPGGAAEIGAALDAEGVETRTIGALQLPSRLSDLESYEGLVLVDVSAADLSLDQMANVREFVRSEGRGLVAVGGRNAFTLGAYKDTPLEEALPLRMDPPPRPQRSDISLLLIVDRSASMTAVVGVSKFDMAKEAAILSTESLQPEDRIGILAFDTGNLWVVPFQQVGQGLGQAQIQQQILNLPSGGGTDIEQALAVGLPALAQQPGEVRHAVLLTDGRSFVNNLAAYQQLVETARAQQITLSTIAIGYDADLPLLEQLAEWGGGRYYFAGTPEDIPRLTLLESEIARADPVVEEPLRAELAVVHPLMRDFAPADLPELEGYVAVTPRETADVVLRSPDGDPLLASWQYGLGRAVAFTPSAAAPWAGAWLGWPSYGRFWAQVVRYTLPEPDSGPLQVQVQQRPGGVRLTVDAVQPGGAPLDLATVNARVTLPDGSARDFDVRQTAPGTYSQDLALPNPGPYAVSVVLVRDGQLRETLAGFAQPPPAEYRIADADRQAEGRALLEAVAAATGGAVLAAAPLEPAEAGAAPEEAPAEAPLWPWLLGAALALWVLEIAVRRGLFIRQ